MNNLTTLCYLEREHQYLMMHRIKKQHDINHDKWVGVGGHFEEGESPEDCLLREVYEETGLRLLSWRLRGVITFLSDDNPAEYMFLYTADRWSGELRDGDACDEGELAWVDRDAVYALPIWEGDKRFFRLLEENAPFFSLKLRYEGEQLAECVLNGAREG